MDQDIAIKALDLFFSKPVFREEQYLIIFLGGEPLLNFKLIKKVVTYANNKYLSKEIDFLLMTNGSLLNEENVKFIKDHYVKVRITCNLGRGNWEKILTHLLGYDHLGIGFILSDHLIENLYDNFLKIYHLGIKRFYFCPEFLYSQWTDFDLRKLSSQIKKISKFIKKNRLEETLFINYLHEEGQQLKYLDTRSRLKKDVCITQELLNGNFVVMPNGDLFPCDIGTFAPDRLYARNRLGCLTHAVSLPKMVRKLRKVYSNKPSDYIPCLRPELIERKRALTKILNNG